MNEPNWEKCSEEALWKFVAVNLAKAGIDTTLVGGAVVAIYTAGIYRSGDLDIVADFCDNEKLEEAMKKIGFTKTKSRYFKHPRCHHLFVEFPPGPVELGDESPIFPDEVSVDGTTIKILSPTDCIKDRLAGYIHWGSRALFDQAVLVYQEEKSRIDINAIKKWCNGEGGNSQFAEFSEKIAEL